MWPRRGGPVSRDPEPFASVSTKRLDSKQLEERIHLLSDTAKPLVLPDRANSTVKTSISVSTSLGPLPPAGMSNGVVVDEAVPVRPLGSPRVQVAASDVEEVPLAILPGLANEQSHHGGGRRVSECCCCARHHRRLAIWSIVCGWTCIGYRALINSVKAETVSPTDPEAALMFSHRARKLSIISIVTFMLSLAMIFLLVVFVSYLITFIE
ncbi:unnamed protein product [Ophioblennius macclurei]